jgi:bifunctional glutamyl/prolyl-tRNA synthetase
VRPCEPLTSQARDPQYAFIAEACGLRIPQILSFGRFALEFVPISKRQLGWFVETNRVTGWSDPRFPTVRGILKRGLTLEALRKYMIDMGSSTSNALISSDKMWSGNKDIIDPVCPRHTALLQQGLVTVKVAGVPTTKVVRPLHPKNAAVGTKQVQWASEVQIEAADADEIKVGEKFTLMDMGNVVCTSVDVKHGMVRSIEAEFKPDDDSFKGTKKVTFVAKCEEEQHVEMTCIRYGHLLKEPNVTKEDGVDGLQRAARAYSRSHGRASVLSLHKQALLRLPPME